MKTKSPKISVIVPIYNVENYLPNLIDSILKQTFSDFELLLIDDGSSDNSGKICYEYAKKDNRIKFFQKENKGVSSARNLGLKHAIGDWIYFSDADDELYINCLEILNNLICSHIDFIIAGYEKYDSEGNNIYKFNNIRNQILSSKDAISLMFKPVDYTYHGYLWSKLFNRNIIENNNLKFNEEIYFNEDRLFIIQYLCCVSNFVNYTTKPIYKYYIRENSAMSSLEKTFNVKFITDVKAFSLMLNELNAKNDKYNVTLAKQGLYFSYLQIKKMLQLHNIKNNKLERELEFLLRCNVSRFNLLYFNVIYILRALKRKLIKCK